MASYVKRRPFLVASIALMAAIAALWVVSYWRSAGWRAFDESWALAAAGMQELRSTYRWRGMTNGRFEIAWMSMLNAVIPAGSPAAGPERHETNWGWWMQNSRTDVDVLEQLLRTKRSGDWGLSGPGWFHSMAGGYDLRVFSIPLWVMLLAAGMPCWFALWSAAKVNRRRKRGLCVKCGYDRRGHAGGSPCPECGCAH